MRLPIRSSCPAWALLLLLPFAAQGQGLNTAFGKNRVQYHDFDWMQYETEHFTTYWYGDGRAVGQAAVQYAEYDYWEIQNLLEHRLGSPIELIVYTDITDLHQSNIGLAQDGRNTGGTTQIAENKIFVYFNGDHNDLRRQIREGIAAAFLNSMLFGSNIQDIVQNAVLLNLPAWFSQGLIAYVGQDWSSELDDALRDVMLSGRYADFDAFAKAEPRLAGHAMWHFIAQQYGRAYVSNTLYLTRINRSLESAFLYVLGLPYQRVLGLWQQHYELRYKSPQSAVGTDPQGQVRDVRLGEDTRPTRLSLSPDGRRLAYVLNREGRYWVYVLDLGTGKRRRVMRGGQRNPLRRADENYPIVCWHPDNQQLAILYERRDEARLRLLNVQTGKKRDEALAPQFERVYSADFISGQELVITASTGGYSDVFRYRIGTRQGIRITQDYHDDLDAVFAEIGGKRGIIFASNRPDTLLRPERLDTIFPLTSFDLFFFELDGESQALIRLTDTPLADERQPSVLDGDFFSYLSDQSGLRNRYAGRLERYVKYEERRAFLKDGTFLKIPADSLLPVPMAQIDSTWLQPVYGWRGDTRAQSNYRRGIAFASSSPRAGRLVEAFVADRRLLLYERAADTLGQQNLLMTPYMQYRLMLNREQLQKGLPVNRVSAPPSPKDLANVPADPIDREVPKPRSAERRNTPTGEPLAFVLDFPLNQQPLPPPADSLPAPARDSSPAKLPADSSAATPGAVAPIDTTAFIDIDNYVFANEPAYLEEPAALLLTEQPDGSQTLENPNALMAQMQRLRVRRRVHRFHPPDIVPYRLRFRSSEISTQLDNSLLFGGLDSYGGRQLVNAGRSPFQYPPLGLLVKGTVEDLFEDYQIEGGVRVPFNLRGAEYFLVLRDRRQRMDKEYAYYRSQFSNLMDGNQAAQFIVPNPLQPINNFLPYRSRNITDLATASLSWPFDEYRALRGTALLRNDKFLFLSTDGPSLNQPISNEQRLGLRAEFVFDNTNERGMNALEGTRYKLSAELLQRMDINLSDGPRFNLGKGTMGLVQFDARHYVPVLRYGVLAGRVAGAASFGSERVLFYLGGVDNWLNPSFNNDIPLPTSGAYAYQTLAANLRGHRNNIRNGSSYALLNTELRLPVFQYLYNGVVRNAFLRNFQLVGFFDAGTAWEGISPYADDNPLNTVVIQQAPAITVTVNYFREPVVMGYGLGLRSTLFGYFVKLDYAWGWETNTVQTPMLHFSLGLDF